MPARISLGIATFTLASAVVFTSACEQTPKKPVKPSPVTNESPAQVETNPGEESNSTAPSPAASRPGRAGLIPVSGEEVHVGRFAKNERLSPMYPSEYCLDDGKLWQGANYRLGKLNVFGVDDDIAAIEGTNLIAVFGEKKPNLDSRVRELGSCPNPYEPIMVQMRSDWAPLEGGPNTTHRRLSEIRYIEGRSVQSVNMSEVLEGDDKYAELRIRNPFDMKMAGLTVEAHYEGGPGKPMPTMVEQLLALEPGEWTVVRLPRTLGDGPPRTKAGSGLHSLEIRGELGKAFLDIELFVPHR